MCVDCQLPQKSLKTRQSIGDPIESWLHKLLCLYVANYIPNIDGRLPHPTEMPALYVNCDILFSYHKASEIFAAHDGNQLMTNAPVHHLFVLLVLWMGCKTI